MDTPNQISYMKKIRILHCSIYFMKYIIIEISDEFLII